MTIMGWMRRIMMMDGSETEEDDDDEGPGPASHEED